MKPWFLTFHRWLAFIAAAPLFVLVITGLILSVEPIAQRRGMGPNSVTAAEILGVLAAHDPQAQARGLVYTPYDGSVTLTGPAGRFTVGLEGPGGVLRPAETRLSGLFGASRRLHEHLTVFHLDPTVASTCAMVVIIALGTLLGLPRLRNTVAGWHQAVAWSLLPLLILSPLTGLFLAWGVTLNASPSRQPRAAPLPLADAIRAIAEQHDLSNLMWVRQRGGQQLARLWDGQEARVFSVTSEGLQPASRNFARLFHEGNFLGAWSGALNLLISLAFLVLLATGSWLFARREIRRFAARRQRVGLSAGRRTISSEAR